MSKITKEQELLNEIEKLQKQLEIANNRVKTAKYGLVWMEVPEAFEEESENQLPVLEEVQEKAFGILFGNADRLKEPGKRNLDFTDKCKSGAEREKIALIKTIDLFAVAKYLNENDDKTFQKDCRDAIHKGLGKIVEFPEIPNK